MPVREFHPILYVPDPSAERDFYAAFGFETVYQGPEFPGFIAVASGQARFGLSGNREPGADAGYDAVRWQLIVDDVDEVAAVCEGRGWSCEVIIETGGTMHRARIAKVVAPSGITVWFEGPNEAAG